MVFIFLFFLIFSGLILSDTPAFSQSKFELSGGLGVPEYIHASIKYGQKERVLICTWVFSFQLPIPMAVI
jgi:hypothetical protein